ncbi:hypothetical protein DERF_013143 [Dermatophagoides farinae]|uniref:Uncharacterized protein n=1 Tax=Dermatophagoides farinae TaxID=6954 RepID=A0A922HLE3_DERFA|nr:hypothetical protein DERF_013143 [Dermatophagoides farinae]
MNTYRIFILKIFVVIFACDGGGGGGGFGGDYDDSYCPFLKKKLLSSNYLKGNQNIASFNNLPE